MPGGGRAISSTIAGHNDALGVLSGALSAAVNVLSLGFGLCCAGPVPASRSRATLPRGTSAAMLLLRAPILTLLAILVDVVLSCSRSCWMPSSTWRVMRVTSSESAPVPNSFNVARQWLHLEISCTARRAPSAALLCCLLW